MSETLPPCPLCQSVYTYEMGSLLVCPECAHEWQPEVEETFTEAARVVKDASGNILEDGDTVTIAKDLKVKGSSTAIKVGTKVRNIRLVSPVDGSRHRREGRWVRPNDAEVERREKGSLTLLAKGR
jgi:protein PhnA